MEKEAHGGDLLAMAAASRHNPNEIVDFSVNIRPDGTPEYIRSAITKALSNLTRYPSPHAEEVMQAAASRYNLPASRFVAGNGSTELVYALARVLKKKNVPKVWIVEPAFSEYARACACAGLQTTQIWGGILAEADPHLCENQNLPFAVTEQELSEKFAVIPVGSAVFLANPANPSGLFRNPEFYLDWITRRSDLLWIIDEAFIEYAGAEEKFSMLSAHLPENAIVLRSLTKFYALPGIRAGFLAASADIAEAVQNELPVWNCNTFAIHAAVAVLQATSDFIDQNRAENAERRADLCTVLAAIPYLDVFPSSANYILIRWKNIPEHFFQNLLCRYSIAVRDCANYYGLDDGTWFRVAVRFPEDHRKLASAIQQLTEEKKYSNSIPAKKHTPALMLLGTSSNAGKSLLAAAWCRIFLQDGYKVAPFKAQNMSLNSGFAADGKEMALAQIVQAQAAGIAPDVRMNPLLLKPVSDTGSELFVLGHSEGHMSAQEYFQKKKQLWTYVREAYASLAAEYDIIVLEGAGSPAEINLRQYDLVNMRMAEYAHAAVLLAGDIDRGGLYASFLGTWLVFTDAERNLVAGYLVNRFRGDAALLASAHEYLLKTTGIPVSGVIPYMHNIDFPAEDSLAEQQNSHVSEYADEKTINSLADTVREHTDMQMICRKMGLR